MRFLLSTTTLIATSIFVFAATCAAEPIDFARDIRPILSNHCFTCHGPDDAAREADLRLDQLQGASADLGGHSAVVPGDPGKSTLVARINAGPDERMPPADSDLELTPRQIELLTRWVAEGAAYDQHWSFRPIERPLPPDAKDSSWHSNPIDAFIVRKIQAAGLTPSQEAARSTLLRRVCLDLLGLPPTPEEAAAFATDSRPGAYERMVDRVLADPHYGERWGRHWLDQARYADTNGYSIDSDRSIWPYRDWVINAINADLPFDRFTIEQLAGDLMPDATRDQLVATGFHRNTLINQEGGTDREQFRNEAVVDRANTTGAVWLGLTVGCAQCHSHKYDPLTQREYYQLFAFFNDCQDVNGTAPTLSLATPDQEQRLAEFDKEIAKAKKKSEAGKKLDKAQQEQLAAELKQLQDRRKKLATSIPTTMISRDLEKPRQTHVLIRGDFLRKGDAIESGVPAFLPSMRETDSRRTRLDLANWLVSPDNPLTARVTVNRAWARFFGEGLVETENDFGIQGTPPSHPDLLDWLAAELIESGWSMKHLHRLIVTSATYRQSSHVRADLEATDPLNKLLARQHRLRVDAEIVRDLALAVSGLLNEQLGGRGVYPPQPAGVYAFTQVNARWPTSEGADRYRRGVYTFFRRSVPYPMLTTFDVPRFNSTCTLRVRSNTPLQSLTMANDQGMLEHVRALGRRLSDFSSDDQAQIEHAYQLCFSRLPEPNELQALSQFVVAQRADFMETLADAKAFAGTSDSAKEPLVEIELSPADTKAAAIDTDDESAVEVAVWTAVARVLLNLDEFITRE